MKEIDKLQFKRSRPWALPATLALSTLKYTYLLREDTLITTDLKFPQHTLAVQQQLSRGHFTQQLCFLWQLHSVRWDYPRNGSALPGEHTASLLVMAAASICPEPIEQENVLLHQSDFSTGTSWWRCCTSENQVGKLGSKWLFWRPTCIWTA